MRLGRARGDHRLGHLLPREGRRRQRMTLRGRRPLAVDRGFRRAAFLHREQRRAGLAIQHEHVAVLGELRYGLHRLAVAHHGDQVRRRRQVPVPQIVLDDLVVPDALAGARVECQHRIGEQVVAVTIDAVPIE